MLVKDVLETAAYVLGREDLVAQLHVGTQPTGDLSTLLRCYNLIENELALDYFPLRREDSFTVVEGKIPFSAFPFSPVEILTVKENCKEVEFCYYPHAIGVSAERVTVSYTFAPKEKEMEEESPFTGKVSARLFAYGIASEFCLAVGQFSEAATWDQKYREAIRAANVSRKKKCMRSRRWE